MLQESCLWENGYTILRQGIPYADISHSILPSLKARALEYLFSAEGIRLKKGIINGEGSVHHLLAFNPYDPTLLEFLLSLFNFDITLKSFFDGPYILNSFGASVIDRNTTSYLRGIHKDIRSAPGHMNYMVNILIMLDDFTEDNGATQILPRSHKMVWEPDEQTFNKEAVSLTGKAGDVVIFNSASWHRAGVNKTGISRAGLTLTLSKPFIKPQFDYLSLYESDYDTYNNKRLYLFPCENEYLKQLLGFYSRSAKSIEEWYVADPKSRTYRGDQE